jgi:hypothetical protein
LEQGSVAYGEIPLVTDRFGSLLLQVKDKKAGNQKIARKGKVTQATSKAQAPLVTVEQVVEERNNRELLHYVPPLDINENPGTLLDNSQPPPEISKSQAHAARPLTNDFMPHIPFPTLAHPPRDIGARKEVRFELLPAAEISSIPNGPSGNDRMAQIERLKAQLSALQGGHEPIKTNDTPYEILDVSMDHGGEMLSVIALRAPNTDHQRLFQFERPPAPLPRGETGRHHAPAQPVCKAKPAISSTLFYQGVTGPPSARASKGKQRARPSSGTAKKGRIDSHPPSSPLEQYDAYSHQRYLTNKSAGPSRETYM